METKLLKTLVEVSPFALHHEIILNNRGEPIDYTFLAVNPEFEKLTGLKEKYCWQNSKASVSRMVDTHFDWIKLYGEVALTGNSNLLNSISSH